MDTIIALSYMAIPLCLLHFFRQHKKTPYLWIVVLFAFFIVGCGLTHVMGAIVAYWPLYRLDFWIKTVTAIASLGTTIILWKTMPEITAWIKRGIENDVILHIKNKRYEHVINHAHKAMIVINSDGVITEWNKAAEQMFGWDETIIGQKVVETIIPPEYREQHLRGIAEYQRTGMGSIIGRYIEVTGLCKDGSLIPIEIMITALPGDKNYSMAFIRDLTDQKKLQQTLENNNKELEKVNKELEQFAYIASHDLKAPLRGIMNISSWIQEDLQDSDKIGIKKNLALLQSRVKIMHDLVEGILTYSRAGRLNKEVELVDVGAIIEKVLQSLPPHNFKITQSSSFPIIMGNEINLMQIFGNLIGNAIKHHNKTEGNIDITVRDTGNFWEFAVTDDGPGIEKNLQHKLFILFSTLQPKTETGSTGIGLSLCKKLVENMGGTINVESDKNEGAKFYFTWPK